MTEKIRCAASARPPRWRRWPSRWLSERFGAYVTGASIVVDGGIALHNWIDPRHEAATSCVSRT